MDAIDSAIEVLRDAQRALIKEAADSHRPMTAAEAKLYNRYASIIGDLQKAKDEVRG